jgi:hypothetical protein
MAKRYVLEATPRQQFNVQVDNDLFTFVIKGYDTFTTVDVLKNGISVIFGSKLIPNAPLFPVQYQSNGIFSLVCLDEREVVWQNLGKTVSLYHFSESELP